MGPTATIAAVPDSEAAAAPAPPESKSNTRAESYALIILSVTIVLIAWAAFEAAKWGGEQSIQFSVAGASRTESARNDTAGGQIAQIDISAYNQFIAAYSNEVKSGEIEPYDGTTFTPTPGTLSDFFYGRFRDEFRPIMDAWMATDPSNNPGAPPTPFDMTEYKVAEFIEGDRLAAVADEAAVAAREANQNGDNYVLTAVLFATVLFFAGVAGRLENPRIRRAAILIAIIGVIVGVAILITLPILI